MTLPQAATSPRIPLHSAVAKPTVWIFTVVYAVGICGLAISSLKGEQDVHPIAVAGVALCLGVMIWKMWDLCQRVYMTSEGIELTKPPRVIPWRQIGDAFRVPLTGHWPSTCCIGINEPDNWDLRFFGRSDFEAVVTRFRASNDCQRDTSVKSSIQKS